MKDSFGWLCRLLVIVLAYAALIALGLFLNCLPALVLVHMLKG